MARPKIRFFYNGLKVDGGKLYKGHLSWGVLSNSDGKKCLTFYADESLPQAIHETFLVRNESNDLEDYFDEDKFRIRPDDEPYFSDAAKAAITGLERAIARKTRRGDAYNLRMAEHDRAQIEELRALLGGRAAARVRRAPRAKVHHVTHHEAPKAARHEQARFLASMGLDEE